MIGIVFRYLFKEGFLEGIVGRYNLDSLVEFLVFFCRFLKNFFIVLKYMLILCWFSLEFWLFFSNIFKIIV